MMKMTRENNDSKHKITILIKCRPILPTSKCTLMTTLQTMTHTSKYGETEEQKKIIMKRPCHLKRTNHKVETQPRAIANTNEGGPMHSQKTKRPWNASAPSASWSIRSIDASQQSDQCRPNGRTEHEKMSDTCYKSGPLLTSFNSNDEVTARTVK